MFLRCSSEMVRNGIEADVPHAGAAERRRRRVPWARRDGAGGGAPRRVGRWRKRHPMGMRAVTLLRPGMQGRRSLACRRGLVQGEEDE